MINFIELRASDPGTASQPASSLPAPFPNLPENPRPEQVANFLHQLAQTIEQIEFFASEVDLRLFIRWALEQSYSSHFTQDQKFQLLSLAWEAQKLIWAIRSPSCSNYAGLLQLEDF